MTTEAVKKPLVGDAYLVVARTNLDEIPLALCPTYEHAHMEANSATEEQIYKIANEVLGVDNAGICNIAIITFLGGKPIDLEIVRDWDQMGDLDNASVMKETFKKKRGKK